jgi:hypothetical protein
MKNLVSENKSATPWTQEVKDVLVLVDKLAETVSEKNLSEAELHFQGKAHSLSIYMKR